MIIPKFIVQTIRHTTTDFDMIRTTNMTNRSRKIAEKKSERIAEATVTRKFKVATPTGWIADTDFPKSKKCTTHLT